METLRQNWKPILQIAGFVVVQNVGFYIVLTYMSTYFPAYLGFSTTAAFVSTMLAGARGDGAHPTAWRPLRPRRAKTPVPDGERLLRGAGLPAVRAHEQGQPDARRLAHVAFAIIEALFVCATLAAGAELFTTRVRYGGLLHRLQLLGGDLRRDSPLVATFLIDRTGNPLSPSYYVIFAAVATLITVLTMRETAGPGSHRRPQKRSRLTPLSPAQDAGLLHER